MQGKRGRLGWGMRSGPGHGEPNPVWIPKAHRAARLLAEEIGGTAFGTWTDLFDIPMTAHFLGGCTIGDSAATGVIDPYHRVYASYQHVAPVTPRNPAVPADAPAALRLLPPLEA